MLPIERKFEYPFSIQGVASVGDSTTATGSQAAISTADCLPRRGPRRL